jgi:hypothetical protein
VKYLPILQVALLDKSPACIICPFKLVNASMSQLKIAGEFNPVESCQNFQQETLENKL